MTAQFGYLLNAMERAACESNPAEHDYKGKRIAVLGYVSALEVECERLRAELAECKQDAERYRWLRSDDCPFSCYEQEGPDNWGWCPTSSRDLDEAIDAAMAGDSAPESAATATRL